MRLFYLLGILVILAAVLVTCSMCDTSQSKRETELPEAVQATLATSEPPQEMAVPAVVKIAAPLSTAEPAQERLYRSYPAPTGYPGFASTIRNAATPAATPIGDVGRTRCPNCPTHRGTHRVRRTILPILSSTDRLYRFSQVLSETLLSRLPLRFKCS